MGDKTTITISVDRGLSDKVKDKGYNISAICNKALNNELLDKDRQVVLTKEEFDKQRADYQTVKSGMADITSDYNLLDTSTKQQIQQLREALSGKDTELIQKGYTLNTQRQTIDRQSKEIIELTTYLKDAKDNTHRLSGEFALKEQRLNQEISSLKDANTSQEKAYTQQITDKDATISTQHAEIYTLKQELNTQNSENRNLKDIQKNDRHDYGELKDKYNLLQKKQNLFGYNYIFLPILTLFAVLLVLYVVRTPIISGFSYVLHTISGFFGWVYTSITNVKIALPSL